MMKFVGNGFSFSMNTTESLLKLRPSSSIAMEIYNNVGWKRQEVV